MTYTWGLNYGKPSFTDIPNNVIIHSKIKGIRSSQKVLRENEVSKIIDSLNRRGELSGNYNNKMTYLFKRF